MPLLRFDLGKVFGQYVGQSEDNIRRAIMTAESVAPCVLWIDEIEKGFAGVGASDLDSGVTARVFGTFITWLNEKTKPVFVVATANNISRLPPELMRKGRFDEIFFVDLPNAHEREEIFAVHLRRRDLDPSRFDLKQLSDLAEGFSGADIETVVAAAVEAAYSQPDSRWATTEDIIRAIRATMPLSVTLKEQIEAMRGWARTRARPASTPWEEVPVPVEEEFVRRRKLEF
jgi:SpoVK/Ycf46/Vps4 family AAA+-type ATPase